MSTLPFVLYLFSAVAWGVLFWGDFPVLFNEWGQEDYSHCFLVMPVVGYLVWTERARIKRSSGGGVGLGLLVCTVALSLFYIGRFGSLKFFAYMAMWLTVCGAALLALGNRSVRALWMPMLVGFFAIPLPAFITRITSLKLRLISSVLSEKMLQIVGIPVYREGNVIDLGVIQLQVVDACSGLRYLWPSLLMALLIGWFFLRSPWKRLALLVIAIPVTIFSNAFRIALTGVLTKFIDPSLAEGFFHDFSGWLVYVFSLGALGFCAFCLSGKESVDETPRPVGGPLRGRPSLLAGVVLCCSLGLMVFGQEYLMKNQVIPTRKDFQSFPRVIGEWEGNREYLSKPVLESLGADDYLNAVFRNPRTGDIVYLLVSWYDKQTTSHAAHAPTSCLVGGGWGVESKQVLSVEEGEPRSFPVTQMMLDKNGRLLISNFWFLQRGKVVVSEWLNKWYLLVDALLMQRTDGALVRIEMPVRGDSTTEEAQRMLSDFAGELQKSLIPYLPELYESTAM